MTMVRTVPLHLSDADVDKAVAAVGWFHDRGLPESTAVFTQRWLEANRELLTAEWRSARTAVGS